MFLHFPRKIIYSSFNRDLHVCFQMVQWFQKRITLFYCVGHLRFLIHTHTEKENFVKNHLMIIHEQFGFNEVCSF